MIDQWTLLEAAYLTGSLYAAKKGFTALKRARTKSSLERILTKDEKKALTREIEIMTGERIGVEAFSDVETEIEQEQTNAVNREGYILKAQLQLASGKRIDLITKYAPVEQDPLKAFFNATYGWIYPFRPLVREEVNTGGLVQRYLHNLVGLDFVPASILTTERAGNVSLFVNDSVPLTEYEKTLGEKEREELAEILSKKSLRIALTPLQDAGIVKEILFRKRDRHYETRLEVLTKRLKRPNLASKKTKRKDENATAQFLSEYQKIVSTHLDARGYYLSHNDLYSHNILVPRGEEPKIIDFDNARFQNFYCDIFTLLKTLGLTKAERKESKKRIQETIRATLEEILKCTSQVRDKTAVPGKDGPLIIGVGKPYEKPEFERTAHLVEFDYDLNWALKIESDMCKIKACETKTEERQKAIIALKSIRDYFYTRAMHSINELNKEQNIDGLVTKYQAFLESMGRPVLSQEEFARIEKKYDPDINTWQYMRQFKHKPTKKEIEDRKKKHSEKIIAIDSGEEKGIVFSAAGIGTVMLNQLTILGKVAYDRPELLNEALRYSAESTLMSIPVMGIVVGAYLLMETVSKRRKGIYSDPLYTFTSNGNSEAYRKAIRSMAEL